MDFEAKRKIARDKLKEEVLSLDDKKTSFLLDLPTGTGKTNISISLIEKTENNFPWIIFTPEIAQRNSLKKDFIDLGKVDTLVKKVKDIVCYKSLINYLREVDGAVNIWFDEFHHLSDNMILFLQNFYAERMIFTSATVNTYNLSKIVNTRNLLVKRVSVAEAIERHLLPKFKFYLIGIKMPTYYEKLIEAKKIKKQRQVALSKGNFTRYNYLRHPYNEIVGSFKIPMLQRIRSSYLNSEEQKKVLFFNTSIENSEKLSKKYSVNSKKTKKENEKIIADFIKSNQNTEIHVMDMLREGVNLYGITTGVVSNLDSLKNEMGKFIQQIGRVSRSAEPEIIIVYIDNLEDDLIYRFKKTFQETKCSIIEKKLNYE